MTFERGSEPAAPAHAALEPLPGTAPAPYAPARLPASQPPPAGLFDELPDGVWRFDRALNIVYTNPAMVQAMAVPWVDMAGRRLGQIEAFAQFAPMWEAKLNAVFDTLQGRSFKFTYPHPVGARSFEVRLFVENAATGEASHVTALARDITVPRSALRANRAADSLVSTLMAGARTGMAVLDRDLRYIRCNSYLVQLLGVESRQLLGRRLDEAFALDAQADVMRSLLQMRDGQLRVPHQVEYLSLIHI